PADQRRGVAIAHRPVRIVGRITFATGTVLPIAAPANAALGVEVDRLPRSQVDAAVGPRRRGLDDGLALAHPRRTPVRIAVVVAVVIAVVAVTAAAVFEFDADDLVAVETHGAAAARSAPLFEFDLPVANANQLTLDARAV